MFFCKDEANTHSRLSVFTSHRKIDDKHQPPMRGNESQPSRRFDSVDSGYDSQFFTPPSELRDSFED